MQTFMLIVALPILIVLFVHLRAVGKFDRYVRTAMQYVRKGLGADNETRVDLETIPQVIRDFARRAGVPATNAPLSASFHQLSEMRMNPEDAWIKLRAEEVMSAQKLGFVWYAEQKRSIFVMMRVVDALVDGSGTLNVRLLGSLPLVDLGGPGTDKAELMRYLAELPWVPDALLHNPNLRWREIEPDLIEVEAGAGDALAKIRFRLDGAGDIVEMEADARARSEGSEVVQRPWRASYRDYKTIEGAFAGETGYRRIPTRAEVGWILDDGYFAYWRGQIATYGLEHPESSKG